MAWKLNEWLKFKDYPYQDERSAYTAGYNDAWYGYPKWTSNMRDYYPAEYTDGYVMGLTDRAEPEAAMAGGQP